MNDFMYEQLVKRKTRITDYLIRILTVALIVAVVLIGPGFVGLYALVIAIALALLAGLFLFPRLKVEYEYALVNHDMQIDIIYNRARRKKLLEFDILKAEAIVPADSSTASSAQVEKTYNCSSGTGSQEVYAVLVNTNHQNARILIEPDETMKTHINSWINPSQHLK